MGLRSFTARRRTAKAALAAVVAAPLLALAPATEAAADPGFCGVRVDGPTVVGADNPTFAYRVRNKCGDAHRFLVYFPRLGRGTFCAPIDPYGSYTYSYLIDDDWWEVRSC